MKLSSDIRNAKGNYPYKYKQLDMARLNKWYIEAGQLEDENEALREYTNHNNDCGIQYYTPNMGDQVPVAYMSCTCGLGALRTGGVEMRKTRMLKRTIHIHYDLWDKDGNYLWDENFENYISNLPGWWASGANTSGRIIRDHAIDLPRIGFSKHLAEIKSKLPEGGWISA